MNWKIMSIGRSILKNMYIATRIKHFSSFEKLLYKDKSITFHQRNCRILATDMHEILNSLSPDNIQNIFETKSNYSNTGNAPVFSSRNIKIAKYGLQIICYMASNIWDLLPKEMKQVTTLNKL